MTRAGAYCPSHFGFRTVSNQAECQDVCTAIEACVGISYRGSDSMCGTCQDDKLNTGFGYDFYIRPGESMFFFS